jgi:hypothetical protein
LLIVKRILFLYRENREKDRARELQINNLVGVAVVVVKQGYRDGKSIEMRDKSNCVHEVRENRKYQKKREREKAGECSTSSEMQLK